MNRTRPKSLTYIASFVLTKNSMTECYFYCPHFADEETEAQSNRLSQGLKQLLSGRARF